MSLILPGGSRPEDEVNGVGRLGVNVGNNAKPSPHSLTLQVATSSFLL